MKSRAIVAASFGLGFCCLALAAPGPTESQAIELLMANISSPGAAPGAVVAAPRDQGPQGPDYFYHWVRDAGLVMDVVARLYARETDTARKAAFERALLEFVRFSRRNQLTPTPSGHLGEPKFNADGSAFHGPWGRPQNDGPALRALALIRLARAWLAEGQEATVREWLYDGKFPTQSVIKTDLEFVASRWRESCFDLWEEVRGKHFYTRVVQRQALVEGASLALRLGDPGAAQWYLAQARGLESELDRHWDPRVGAVVPTLERDGGIDYKTSGLDASVILAVLHAGAGADRFGPLDERVLSSFRRLENEFAGLYPINHKGWPAVAIGRYPEDRYDGVSTGREGNPWVLLTLAFGEFLRVSASAAEAAGRVAVTPVNVGFLRAFGASAPVGAAIAGAELARLMAAMRVRAEEYVARGRLHADGVHLSEQINRHGGQMQGARDLSWSYAALLTAGPLAGFVIGLPAAGSTLPGDRARR